MDPDFPSLERKLLAEISRIGREIATLQDEQAAFEKMLRRVRRQEMGAQHTPRSNSIRRVMAEQAILAAIRGRSGAPCSAQQLHATVQRTISGVGRATFASYLNRMKEKGLIDNPSFGQWVLTAAGRTAANSATS